MKRLIRLLFCCLLAAAALAHAGDNKSRKIVLDTTPEGGGVSAPVKDLPLLVRLHSGNFNFADAKPDGSDLRFFTGDGKTPLKHFVERWDAPNELGMVWVLLPSLAPNAKTDSILMRWGDESAAGPADPGGVYDASHLVVLNFSDPEGWKDATARGNHGRKSGARLLPAGPIAGAAQFDGGGGIELPASSSLKLTSADGWTFAAWINPADLKAGGLLLAPGAFSVELADGLAVVRQGKTVLAKATVPLKAGIWQHLAVRVAGGMVAFSVDGAPAGDAQVTVPDSSGDLVVGEALRAGLDAVSLSRGARNDAWIKASVKSQMADGGLVVFGDEDEGGGEASASYFRILIGAVTLDGWVVIGLLGVMGVVSLYVMISKTMTLGRTEKANRAFLALFKQRSEDMLRPGHAVHLELADNRAIRDASIYQLYGIGIDELGKRVPADAVHDATLSAASLEAIRASLDAAIVRAGQRFNRGIVLLTIAISGGPFLGLLGTVVGVMITFAAIAAAGDVNVNSIAPGIAAALVATVAGLAVAIPALFAYNWFAIRIKNVAADTQVFADEFLTRAAEMYTR